MRSSGNVPTNNHLLDELPLILRGRISRQSELIDINFGDVLCEPGKPFSHVYFPVTGFISLIASVDDHKPLELGMIGREGMLGATMSLGITNAPMRAIVQASGTALRMSAAQLQLELADAPALVAKLDHYVYVLLAQLAKLTACIHFHEIEPRLARWLLMAQDRTCTDRIHLTQEFLAEMLGVRRSGISVAAGDLQDKKLIHYIRGEIKVLDRAGLELAACSCYHALLQDYAAIIN